MKKREYYERLISDSLDRTLSSTEVEELEQAMREYPDLVEFRETVLKQAELMRSLPEFAVRADLPREGKRVARRNVFRLLWNIRVALPLPVAALLLLALLGSVLVSLRPGESPSTTTLHQKPTTIQYVQIERLEPAAAVLIEQNENEHSSQEETL